MPNSVLMAGRQSPDLIGVAQGPFVTTSVGSAGGQGPVAGILTSAIVIGTSAPSNSPISK